MDHDLFSLDHDLWMCRVLLAGAVVGCLSTLAWVACSHIYSLYLQIEERQNDRQNAAKVKAFLTKASTPLPDVVCAICLDEDEASKGRWRELPCGHHFHMDCMLFWLDKRMCCPLCRCDVDFPRHLLPLPTPMDTLKELIADAVAQEEALSNSDLPGLVPSVSSSHPLGDEQA